MLLVSIDASLVTLSQKIHTIVFKSFSLCNRTYLRSGAFLSLPLKSTWVSLSLSILQISQQIIYTIAIAKKKKQIKSFLIIVKKKKSNES